jgi:putative hydrolase of HD superfamily
VALTALLPANRRDEVVALWDEYAANVTPEAQLAKALDKLETILQHTQGANPSDFDHEFNLRYGRQFTERPPLVAAIRALLDQETARLAASSKSAPHPSSQTVRPERMTFEAAGG